MVFLALLTPLAPYIATGGGVLAVAMLSGCKKEKGKAPDSKPSPVVLTEKKNELPSTWGECKKYLQDNSQTVVSFRGVNGGYDRYLKELSKLSEKCSTEDSSIELGNQTLAAMSVLVGNSENHKNLIGGSFACYNLQAVKNYMDSVLGTVSLDCATVPSDPAKKVLCDRKRLIVEDRLGFSFSLYGQKVVTQMNRSEKEWRKIDKCDELCWKESSNSSEDCGGIVSGLLEIELQ